MNFLSGLQLLYFFMEAKIFTKFFSWTKWTVYQEPNSCTLFWGQRCIVYYWILDTDYTGTAATQSNSFHSFSILFPGYFCTIPLLFQCYFHATFTLFPYYFSAISMLSSGYFAALFPCYFTDDARNQSNYIKTNYPLEENGMYQRLLYLFTRFEVLPNSNWHQKSVFRENCLKWKLSVEIPYFTFSSCQHLTLWNTNTTIRLV